MNNEKEPLLMDHDADGITELDNNLPGWWVWLFILSCVWALGYMVYYHALGGPSQMDEYQTEVATASAAKPVEPAPSAESTAVASVLSEPSTEEAILAQGKEVFMKNCMVCHAADGGGLIGPNMCDDYFIHGPLFTDSIRTIEEGVLAKGMISWKGVLKPEEIHAVASYIYTLRGTTPAAPKAPEGEMAAR
jgi:cytochrome c oxidase cbb3-type subunit 3